MAKSIVHNSPLIGTTGQLKRAITQTIQDAAQMAAEICSSPQILDDLDIPAESDDGQAYRLSERVRQLADLAELVLIGDADTSHGRALRLELNRLRQQNRILKSRNGVRPAKKEAVNDRPNRPDRTRCTHPRPSNTPSPAVAEIITMAPR